MNLTKQKECVWINTKKVVYLVSGSPKESRREFIIFFLKFYCSDTIDEVDGPETIFSSKQQSYLPPSVSRKW